MGGTLRVFIAQLLLLRKSQSMAAEFREDNISGHTPVDAWGNRRRDLRPLHPREKWLDREDAKRASVNLVGRLASSWQQKVSFLHWLNQFTAGLIDIRKMLESQAETIAGALADLYIAVLENRTGFNYQD